MENSPLPCAAVATALKDEGPCPDGGWHARAEGANCWCVFKLAYVSFMAAMVSTPVHFLADKGVTRWAVLCLIALAIAFVTAGMLRRP